MSIDILPDTFIQNEYGFKKVTRADFSQIRQWLDAPHLAEWWTPGEEELGAIQADEDGRTAFIVDHNALPFAYLQVVDASLDPALSEQLNIDKGTLKFDQFVGDTQMIGFGHGIKFIKAFVAAMKENPKVSKLMVTPAKDNVFAARSYSQAGFRPEKTINYQGLSVSVMGQAV